MCLSIYLGEYGECFSLFCVYIIILICSIIPVQYEQLLNSSKLKLLDFFIGLLNEYRSKYLGKTFVYWKCQMWTQQNETSSIPTYPRTNWTKIQNEAYSSFFFFFRTLFMLLSKMINQMQHFSNAASDIPHIPPFNPLIQTPSGLQTRPNHPFLSLPYLSPPQKLLTKVST